MIRKVAPFLLMLSSSTQSGAVESPATVVVPPVELPGATGTVTPPVEGGVLVVGVEASTFVTVDGWLAVSDLLATCASGTNGSRPMLPLKGFGSAIGLCAVPAVLPAEVSVPAPGAGCDAAGTGPVSVSPLPPFSRKNAATRRTTTPSAAPTTASLRRLPSSPPSSNAVGSNAVGGSTTAVPPNGLVCSVMVRISYCAGAGAAGLLGTAGVCAAAAGDSKTLPVMTALSAPGGTFLPVALVCADVPVDEAPAPPTGESDHCWTVIARVSFSICWKKLSTL